MVLTHQKGVGDHLEPNSATSLQLSHKCGCKNFWRESGIAEPPTGFVCGCAETWKFRFLMLDQTNTKHAIECW